MAGIVFRVPSLIFICARKEKRDSFHECTCLDLLLQKHGFISLII